ncbi:MAG: hypothetical protein IJ599_01705 [Alphaproteobacteria bacterium]|nr:hypothetical protein [Alphaproteobacteria bacterium]
MSRPCAGADVMRAARGDIVSSVIKWMIVYGRRFVSTVISGIGASGYHRDSHVLRRLLKCGFS